MAKFVYLPQLKKALNLDCVKNISLIETDDQKIKLVFYDSVSGYTDITVDSLLIAEKILKKILRATEGFSIESEEPAPPEPFDIVIL